jgi:hypothetical protein
MWWCSCFGIGGYVSNIIIIFDIFFLDGTCQIMHILLCTNNITTTTLRNIKYQIISHFNDESQLLTWKNSKNNVSQYFVILLDEFYDNLVVMWKARDKGYNDKLRRTHTSLFYGISNLQMIAVAGMRSYLSHLDWTMVRVLQSAGLHT